MPSVAVLIFMGSVAAAFASWIFGIAEAIGVWRFWPWAFRLGLKVFEEQLPRPTKQIPNAGRLISDDLRAAVLHGSQTQILFRAPMPAFRFRIHTPLPIHGVAILAADAVYVTGRIPLGPLGFLAAWIIGWTTGGVMTGFQKPLGGLGIVALGWLFAGAMILFSMSVERPRFKSALQALVRRVTETA